MAPSRTYVRTVIGQEALAANIHADAVINMDRGAGVVAKRAMRRILSETGCTPRELADLWGCEVSTVYQARREPSQPTMADTAALSVVTRLGGYDDFTIQHLRWRYGDARTQQIVAGKDPKTNADLAAWKRLGGSPAEIKGRGA